MHFSRRSVVLADMIDVNSFDEIYNKLKSIMKKTATVGDLYNVLNVKKDKYSIHFADKKIFNLTTKEKETIYKNIIDDVKKNSVSQKNLIKKYLQQNNIVGEVAFVDIGWRGTIQYVLTSNYSNLDIIGYYFGINKDSRFNNYSGIKRKGYLFDNSVFDDNQSLVSLSIGLFETMFLNNEGTTIGYNEKNGIVYPVLEDVENNLDIVKYIQAGALDFINDIKEKGLEKYICDYDSSIFFNNYEKIAKNPKLSDIKMFSKVEFYGYKTNKLITNHSLFYYLLHPLKFVVEFNNSYCKVMFLKNTFKINLPYYYVLKLLYRLNKR